MNNDTQFPVPRARKERNASHWALGIEHSAPTVRKLGLVDYQRTWQDMQRFTAARSPDTADELWLLQHPPVYTLGLAGRAERLPQRDNGIPVVNTDRGGQVTYHGPGQIVIYTLLDLNRLGIRVRALVRRLECAVVDLLAEYGVDAAGRDDAPGVYVGDAKIAALGLRIRRGCSYHGLAFNVDMDLAPFSDIDPCGYAGMPVTQARDLGIHDDIETLGRKLVAALQSNIWRIGDEPRPAEAAYASSAPPGDPSSPTLLLRSKCSLVPEGEG